MSPLSLRFSFWSFETRFSFSFRFTKIDRILRVGASLTVSSRERQFVIQSLLEVKEPFATSFLSFNRRLAKLNFDSLLFTLSFHRPFSSTMGFPPEYFGPDDPHEIPDDGSAACPLIGMNFDETNATRKLLQLA